MQQNTRFIIHGIHITENLLHHKAADVRRILEEKGFEEDTRQEGDGATHFYPAPGTPDSAKLTEVVFDEGGFVLEAGGVKHTG